MIPFADAAGARLAKASQHDYLFAWRRFLGFLAIHEPTALELAPAERLTIDRVRAFVLILRRLTFHDRSRSRWCGL